MANEQYVLEHYRNIAKQFGLRAEATLRDTHIRKTEIDFILSGVFEFIAKYQRFPRLLDAGCGNGHTLKILEELFPEMDIAGFEYSKELLHLAKSRNLKAQLFYHDIRDPFPTGKYDLIITQRVLINLLSRKQQRMAIRNIKQALAPKGEYLMIESFDHSLHNLNVLLGQNGFEEVVPSKHNFFIKNGVLSDIEKIGFRERIGPIPANQLSTYFVLTRVLHPMLRLNKQKRLNNKLIDFFIQGLDQAAGDFSPIKFYHFDIQ